MSTELFRTATCPDCLSKVQSHYNWNYVDCVCGNISVDGGPEIENFSHESLGEANDRDITNKYIQAWKNAKPEPRLKPNPMPAPKQPEVVADSVTIQTECASLVGN